MPPTVLPWYRVVPVTFVAGRRDTVTVVGPATFSVWSARNARPPDVMLAVTGYAARAGGVGEGGVLAWDRHGGGRGRPGRRRGAGDEGADRQLQVQRDGGAADGDLNPQIVLQLEAPVSRPGQIPVRLHGIPPRREGCRVSAGAVQPRRSREGTRDEPSEDDREGRVLKGVPVESKAAGYRDVPRSEREPRTVPPGGRGGWGRPGGVVAGGGGG